MKRNHLRTLLVVSSLVLTVAVVFSPVMAGGPSCGSKASGSCSNICPSGCELCPTPGSCGSCSGPGQCSWDQTQWKGLRYDSDGTLKKDLSARQAQKVARQYLEKLGMEKSKVKVVSDDDECFTIIVKKAGHDVVHKLAVSKKTAWIRPESV